MSKHREKEKEKELLYEEKTILKVNEEMVIAW